MQRDFQRRHFDIKDIRMFMLGHCHRLNWAAHTSQEGDCVFPPFVSISSGSQSGLGLYFSAWSAANTESCWVSVTLPSGYSEHDSVRFEWLSLLSMHKTNLPLTFFFKISPYTHHPASVILLGHFTFLFSILTPATGEHCVLRRKMLLFWTTVC